MIRITAFAGALLCLLFSAAAEARSRQIVGHPGCNVLWPCAGVSASPRGERIARAVGFGAAQKIYKARESGDRSSGLVAPLQAKLASIQSACPGTAAISGVRHTYVAGTRRISLHASGKAVDVRGPYGCILSELRGWPGGHSIDPWRVKHIHISYDAEGGREMGLAFRHGGHRHRYAHRHHRRYASAGR